MFVPEKSAERIAAAAAAGNYPEVLKQLSTLLGPYEFAHSRAASYFHASMEVDLSNGTYISDGTPAGDMMAFMAARALEAAGPDSFTAAIDGPGNEPIAVVCQPGSETRRCPWALDAALAGVFAALIEREIGGLDLGPVPYHPAPKRPRDDDEESPAGLKRHRDDLGLCPCPGDAAGSRLVELSLGSVPHHPAPKRPRDDDEESPAGLKRHRDDLGLCPRPGGAGGARLVELELRNAELAKANVELERRLSHGLGQWRNQRCCCGRKGCAYDASFFAPR